MGIIVDIIIILIGALCIGLGYKRGFTGSIIKIISFILALIIAFLLYKPVSKLLIEKTEIDEKIKETIEKTIIKNDNQESKNEEIKENPNFKEIVEGKTLEVKKDVVEVTVNTCINVLVGILVFILAKIILAIISLFIKEITKLPIIQQVDQIGGMAYGIIEWIIIVYVILTLIYMISMIWNNNIMLEAVNKSTIGNILYKNNIILKLIFK